VRRLREVRRTLRLYRPRSELFHYLLDQSGSRRWVSIRSCTADLGQASGGRDSSGGHSGEWSGHLLLDNTRSHGTQGWSSSPNQYTYTTQLQPYNTFTSNLPSYLLDVLPNPCPPSSDLSSSTASTPADTLSGYVVLLAKEGLVVADVNSSKLSAPLPGPFTCGQ